MDRLLDAKDNIAEMQEQLIEYLSSGEDAQDLTHLFTKLSIENPAAYELTLLMYQELHTKAKMDRKKITKVITQVLNQSTLTYEKLIQHEAALINHNITPPDLSNDHLHDNQIIAGSATNSASTNSASTTAPVATTAGSATTAPQGLLGILGMLLSPKVIYALLITVVAILLTLSLLSTYNNELYELIISIVKKLVGLTPATKG